MQNHAVPHEIMSVEFKLFGNFMTLREFIFIAASVVVAWFLYFLQSNGVLPKLLAYPMILVFGVGGLVSGLVPYQDRPLYKWIMNYFAAIRKPTQRVWKKEGFNQNSVAKMQSQPAEINVGNIPKVKSNTKKKVKTQEVVNLDKQEENRFKEIEKALSSTTTSSSSNKTSFKKTSNPVQYDSMQNSNTTNIPSQKPTKETLQTSQNVQGSNQHKTPQKTAKSNTQQPTQNDTNLDSKKSSKVQTNPNQPNLQSSNTKSANKSVPPNPMKSVQSDISTPQSKPNSSQTTQNQTQSNNNQNSKTNTSSEQINQKNKPGNPDNKPTQLPPNQPNTGNSKSKRVPLQNQNSSQNNNRPVQNPKNLVPNQNSKNEPTINSNNQSNINNSKVNQRLTAEEKQTNSNQSKTMEITDDTVSQYSTEDLPGVQKQPNTINLVVKDKNGQAVPQVVCVIKNQNGDPVRASISNNFGHILNNIPVNDGTYNIDLSKQGYVFPDITMTLTGEVYPTIEIKAL